MTARYIFHLSIPVADLTLAKRFYIEMLAAKLGRENQEWLDILLWGHQITLQKQAGEVVPISQQGKRHFGVVLSWDEWERAGQRLQALGIQFLSEPTVLFKGTTQEQAKFHLADPSNNIIEVKAYRDVADTLGLELPETAAMACFLPEQIATRRLRLRQPALEDSRVIFQTYAQDDAVCRFMVWKPHASEAITRQFIGSCVTAWQAGRRPYVITARDSNVAIGMLEARLLGMAVDIGYVLARSHWGNGLMPEAITALSVAALESPAIYRAQAICDTENIASQRALEKSGFRREGRLERYAFFPNLSSEPRACFMYARCK
jgi:extradiol dioxygenase family protein/RimJ/RimL family protein N-acetyltransferase